MRPGASLKGYKLVLVPTMPHVSDQAERAFAAADGVVLYGPRTGSKTRHHAMPECLAPGPVSALVKARVIQVSSLRPGLAKKVKGKVTGSAIRWRETVETQGAQTLGIFENGEPALVAANNHLYLACWPDEKLLKPVTKLAVGKAKLETIQLPEGVRLRRRGKLVFAFNYGSKPWKITIAGKVLLGKRSVSPQDLAILILD